MVRVPIVGLQAARLRDDLDAAAGAGASRSAPPPPAVDVVSISEFSMEHHSACHPSASLATLRQSPDGAALPADRCGRYLSTPFRKGSAAAWDKQVGGRRPAGRLCAAGDRPCYYLAVHEVRRAAIQEAAAVNLGPGDEPIENFAPQEGPHRRPVHQKVLDALGPELVAVTLA